MTLNITVAKSRSFMELYYCFMTFVLVSCKCAVLSDVKRGKLAVKLLKQQLGELL